MIGRLRQIGLAYGLFGGGFVTGCIYMAFLMVSGEAVIRGMLP